MLLISAINVKAQTYATPQLKEQAEKDRDTKNQQLGIIEKTPSDTLKDVFPVNPPLPDLSSYLTLTDVEAVNIAKEHDAAEIKRFKKEASVEFERYTGRISMTEMKLYFINRSDSRHYHLLPFTLRGDRLKVTCETCDIDDFILVTSEKDKVVIDAPSPDQGKNFFFRYTFSK